MNDKNYIPGKYRSYREAFKAGADSTIGRPEELSKQIALTAIIQMLKQEQFQHKMGTPGYIALQNILRLLKKN